MASATGFAPTAGPERVPRSGAAGHDANARPMIARVPVRVRLALAFSSSMAIVLLLCGLVVHARVAADLRAATDHDLRSDLERTTNPNRIPDHIRPDLDLRVVPLISGDPDDPAGDGADLADGEAILARLYTRVIDRAAPAFGQILTGLADPACLPAVVHCMAGKDRTGLVAAVLLEILGIAEDDILADYELTGRYRNTERVKESLARLGARRQLPPEVLAGIVRAPRWAMEAALRTVRDRYGDFDAYLTGPGGADPAVPAELRRRLLTPSP